MVPPVGVTNSAHPAPTITPEDSGGDANADAQQASASCPTSAADGSDSALSSVCSAGGCVGEDWAGWPMPNSAVDFAAGAPNLESYTVHGDGTVTDAVTGLMWQQTAPSLSYTWADAKAYCMGLTLAGYADWRLPTTIELISIVDYSKNVPALDMAAFAGGTSEVWSSTPFARTPSTAWEICFAAGDTGGDSVVASNFVRCARGPAPNSSMVLTPARYTVINGTAYDTRTKLTWQQAVPSAPYTWADARTYCANLGVNGNGGWRLPTVKELMTIVDVAKSTSPAIDCEAFPAAGADNLWSSTPFAGFSRQPYAWGVNFDVGHPISIDVTYANSVRCVH
ncbi:MAG: DUF1566 domain-containing protein [Myxococcota bacterium]|nr:DUF1566 domain-containing protein [Myxococcota bacterium]